MADGGDHLLVHFESVATLKSNVNATKGRVADVKSSVMAAASQLKESWGGDSSQKWHAFQTKWQQDCQSLDDALDAMEKKVGQAHDHYVQTENHNANGWPA